MKLNENIFPNRGRVYTTIWMHYMDADKAYRTKGQWQLHKNATSYIEQILEETSHKASDIRPPTSYLNIHPN